MFGFTVWFWLWATWTLLDELPSEPPASLSGDLHGSLLDRLLGGPPHAVLSCAAALGWPGSDRTSCTVSAEAA